MAILAFLELTAINNQINTRCLWTENTATYRNALDSVSVWIIMSSYHTSEYVRKSDRVVVAIRKYSDPTPSTLLAL